MTSSCGPFKQTAGGCVPRTEVFWAQKPTDADPVLLFLQTTCVAGRAVRVLTTDKLGTVPAVGYTEADKTKYVVTRERGASCESPVYVAPCTAPVSAPALSALVCDGVTTIDVQADPSAKQVINAPGTVLSVRMCGPTTAVRIEFNETVLYSASTEQTVVRIREFNEDSGTWSLRYENLDGLPFVGSVPADLYEVTAQINVVRTETPGCANGQGYSQRTTSKYDAETGALEDEVVDWTDSTGAVLGAPPASFELGACQQVTYDVEKTTEAGCANGVQATRFTTYTYDQTTGLLVGAPVVEAPVGFVLGACLPTVHVDRAICANTNTGEIWNMVERTTMNSAGVQSTGYFDPDTSPMLDVTSLFNAIRHGGICECCNDLEALLLTDLVLTKTSSPTQVFAGGTVTFVITLTNNGPSAADGATITDNLPSGFQLTSTNVTVSGGAAGVTGNLPVLTVATLPVGGSVTIEVVGTVIGNDLTNTATATAPAGVIEYPVGNNTGTASVQFCEWLEHHEILRPVSSLMGVYGSTANAAQLSNLGWLDPNTGVLTAIGAVPGANLNALGLDKATNNAVFIDRISGRIYTAYSPTYVITNPSVLQAGPIAAPSAILGALDSTQTWWVGGITGSTGVVATINVATVDPQTGIQTSVSGLTATLNSGSNGFDFDFAPNDDLYALVGLNIYLATKASGYTGWTLVGSVSGVPATAGSVAYDQGTLRGTSSTGQVWQFDLTTLTTVITATLPAGTLMADMSGATDPVCKRFYLNSCSGKYYELNKVVEYVPVGTPIVGDCQ